MVRFDVPQILNWVGVLLFLCFCAQIFYKWCILMRPKSLCGLMFCYFRVSGVAWIWNTRFWCNTAQQLITASDLVQRTRKSGGEKEEHLALCDLWFPWLAKCINTIQIHYDCILGYIQTCPCKDFRCAGCCFEKWLNVDGDFSRLR